MTPESLAVLVTACTAFIVQLGVVLGIILPKLRAQDRAVENVAQDVTSVHTIVNQQRTDAQNYAAALVAALHGAGIAVPLDQSLTFGPLPPHQEPPESGSESISGPPQIHSPEKRLHRA